MIKVLHITESLGGGVSAAIDSYINESNYCDHYLMARYREGDTIGIEDGINTSGRFDYPEQKSKVIPAIKNTVAELKPDIVHLHSSWAGFWGRIALWNAGVKVVYTPHAFAFLRKDFSLVVRFFFFLIELFFSVFLRSFFLAGCSRHECMLGKKMLSNKVVYLNNAANVSDVSVAKNEKRQFTVAMVGRLCKQKDPCFFAETKRIYDNLRGSQSDDVVFFWVGDGDESYKQLLLKQGVVVTGWLERKQVMSLLKESSLYFHCADWEGMPISLIEAALLTQRVLVRGNGYSLGMGLSNLPASPEEAAAYILQRESYINSFEIDAVNIANDCSLSNQSAALRELYS